MMPTRVNSWLAKKLKITDPPPPIDLIVQVESDRLVEVTQVLQSTGFTVQAEAFNFILVRAVPPDQVAALSDIPGVIKVSYNAPVRIGSLLPLSLFPQSLFLGMPIQDPLIGEFGIDDITAPKRLLGPDLFLPLSPFKIAAIMTGNYKFVPSADTKKLLLDLPTDLNGAGVKVAVLDTGIGGPAHPQNLFHVIPYNASFEPDPVDRVGHGSWCLYRVGGYSFNSPYGECNGIAPACTLYSIKVLNTLGMGCLTGSEWVLTTQGYKHPYAVREGNYLINYNVLNGVFEVDRVVTTRQRIMRPDEKLIRLKTSKGHVILLTEDHPVLTQGGIWKCADEISPLDNVYDYAETKTLHKAPQTYLMHAKARHRASKGNFIGKPRVTRPCGICGAPFETMACQAFIKYCSKPCRNEARRRAYLRRPNVIEEMTHYRRSWPHTKEVIAKIRLTRLSQIGFNELQGARLSKWREDNPEKAYQGSIKGFLGQRKSHLKTKGEGLMEWALKRLHLKFEREHPIYEGRRLITVADFAIPQAKIAIFVDGIYWHSLPKQEEKDRRINETLIRNDWIPLRFTDETVKAGALEIAKNIASSIVASVPEDPPIIEAKSVKRQKHKIVYDIQTEKNGTIVVNGIVVHNSTYEVLRGMQMATQLGVKLVSMSLGSTPQGGYQEDPTAQGVEQMYQQGIITVVAAGNSGNAGVNDAGTIDSPGISPHAITVGAWSIMDDAVSYFSSRGPTPDGLVKPDLCSYGGGRSDPNATPVELIVNGTEGWLDPMYDALVDGWTQLQGTSMSTPHIAGLLALVEQDRNKQGKTLTIEEIQSILAEKSNPTKTNDAGYGLAKLSWFTGY